MRENGGEYMKKRIGYLAALALTVVLAAVLWAGTMAGERQPGGIAAKAAGEAVAELTPVTEPVLPLASPSPEEPETDLTEEMAELVEDPLALLEELIEGEITAAETTQETAEEPVSASAGDPVGRVLELVNYYRGQQGLSPLTLDSTLCSAASTRVRETVSNFSHTRPDGSQWYTVSSLAHGENIVMGTGMDADSAMTKWMNSSGHRANIMDGSYGTLGVGYYYSGREVYWVQLFGY